MSCNHDFNTEGFVIKCNLCEETFSDDDFNKEIQKRASISFVEMQRQLQTKDALIKELEGEVERIGKGLREARQRYADERKRADIKTETLTAQIELLTRCECLNTVRDWQDDNGQWKCHGCKNKALLERGNGKEEN